MEIVIGSEFAEKVIPFINESKTSIDIVVFDWRWYFANPSIRISAFNQAIVRAVKRGVAVRALTNSNDTIKTLNGLGVKAARIHSRRLLHCKFMLIDDRFLITGSHNYTQSAFEMNHELSLIVENEVGWPAIRQYFQNLFGLKNG